MSGRILVVEDEALIAELLGMMLEDMGYDVCGSAATGAEALALARQHAPMLVLMDVRLRGPLDGIATATRIRDAVGAPVIFITGSREPETVARIAGLRPAGVLFKPVRFEQLQSAVRQALG